MPVKTKVIFRHAFTPCVFSLEATRGKIQVKKVCQPTERTHAGRGAQNDRPAVAGGPPPRARLGETAVSTLLSLLARLCMWTLGLASLVFAHFFLVTFILE